MAERRRAERENKPELSGPAAKRTAAHTAVPAGAEQMPVPVEPVVAAYDFVDRGDETTRIRLVQSGFGNTADWTAAVDLWRSEAFPFITLVTLACATVAQDLRRRWAALATALRQPASLRASPTA